MAPADSHQADDFPEDSSSHSIPRQPHNNALQITWVPPALRVANGQPEGRREDIPAPVGGVAGPCGVQDQHNFDVPYQGVVDHHPRPLVLDNPAYAFPDVGVAQGIPARAQFNVPVNPERNPFGYLNAPGPVQAGFPPPPVQRVPIANQGRAGDLRQLACLYLHHPGAQVGMVSTEAGTAGLFKVVITLESPDGF